MATVASRKPTRTLRVRALSLQVPLAGWVLSSRLLVLGAGLVGALATRRTPGWQRFDPTGMTTHLGSVGDVLAAPVLRWDGIRYITLAGHGYTTPASTVSFPLYSLLLHALSWVVISPVIAGVVISGASFAVGLLLLHRLARDEFGTEVADATILLLAFAPMSLFFTAVYTESLLLALGVATFYLARRGRFEFACLCATAAALTHVEGVLLVAPLAVTYWRSQTKGHGLNLRGLISWRAMLLLLPPLAVACFFAYLHGQGYGWLAPITNQNMANYGRTTMTTPVMLWKALNDGISGFVQTVQGVRPVAPGTETPFSPQFQNVVYLGVLMISIAALVGAWRRLPKEYAIFATLALIVCTWSGSPLMPLYAFDRYMLPIFPLWMVAAGWLQRQRRVPSALLISVVMLVFYTVEFSRWVCIG